MTTLAVSKPAASSPFGDSAIMLRRNFKHTVRNPAAVFQAVLFPLIIMLMFVYVFGGAFSVGESYIDYATPGLMIMAVSYGLGPTAVAVNSDMAKGIINRFKVMDVSRGAVLTGHVVSTTVRSLIADAAVIGVAFAIGFRPHGSLLDWLGAVGLVILVGLAAAWMTVALGLASKTAETAGMSAVPMIMLPFLSSAFAPADKMAPGIKQFAEYQPFTPIIETLRGLLDGHVVGSTAIVALAWTVGIGVVGYLWAISTFKKRA